MAANLRELIEASRSYADAERRKQTTESISSEDLKKIMSEAMAMGGDVNANVIKLYEEMRKQTSLLVANKKDSTAIAEDKQEAEKVQQDQTDLLEKIVDNTDPKNKEKQKKDDSLGLGAIVAGITAALSGLAGVVSAYVKNIKFFLDLLTPDSLKRKITTIFSDIQKTFSEFGLKFKKIFDPYIEKFSGILSESFTKLKSLFVFDETSNIGKIISGFKAGLDKFLVPFKEAFATIQSLMNGTAQGLEFIGNTVSKISKTIGSVGEYFGKILGLFKGVFSVVSKLAYPLMIIMSVWDTVKGAIEGFEKDGFVGAIAGAIKGLVNSVVMAPLDLLKSAVSWIAGAFGFNKVEQFLDSFSFEGLFSDLIDALTHPLDTLSSMFSKIGDMVDEYIMQPLVDAFAPVVDFFTGIKDSIVGFFEAIEIPKIGFTIPIIDKEVSIGPFYPFRREKTAEVASTAAGTPAETTSVASTAAATPMQRSEVAPITGETTVSASGVTQTLVPPTVNGEVAPTSRQEYYKQQGFTPEQISNLNERQAKIDALKAQDPNVSIDKDLAIADSETAAMVKQAEVARKVEPVRSISGVAQNIGTPSSTIAVPQVAAPQMANAVYGASAENAEAASAATTAGTTNNVVAPTTVNNTTNQVGGYKPDVRNQDSSFKRMLDARYVPV